MADQKPAIDWADIERDYRTGSMSVREIARWYSVSDGAIRKKAKAGGWKRLGTQGGTQAEGASSTPPPVIYTGTILTPENVTPDAIIGRGRNLVLRMMDELDATTSRQGELEALIVSSTEEGDANGQRQAMMQAVSLKSRSDVLKALATAAKTLSETGAPAGVKQARKDAGARVASGAGRFATPAPPRTVQ